MPVGYTAPSNWIGFLLGVPRTPYIQILSTNTLSSFLGFTPGYYPASAAAGETANYSINSNITPLGSTVNSVIVRCSLVNNYNIIILLIQPIY